MTELVDGGRDELFEIANKYKLDVSIESQSKRISTFRMNVLFINR